MKKQKDNLTVNKEVGTRIRERCHDGLHTISGILDELLKFWDKHHCPECGYETVVKEKHHKC